MWSLSEVFARDRLKTAGIPLGCVFIAHCGIMILSVIHARLTPEEAGLVLLQAIPAYAFIALVFLISMQRKAAGIARSNAPKNDA